MEQECWDSCLGLSDYEAPEVDRVARDAANQAGVDLEGLSQEREACTKISLSSRRTKRTSERVSKLSKVAHKYSFKSLFLKRAG